MAENMGEHHASHSAAKGDGFAMYVLPLSILLAAVIVGWSMMSAANTLGTGLSNLTITGGSGDNVLPTPDPGDGVLAPTTDVTLAELSASNFEGTLGSDSAPVVVVEFSDFQCPFCKRFFNDSDDQMKQWANDGTIKLVFKDFPLANLHPMAEPSANAARCAADQGKFWEMHDKIFNETTKIEPVNTASYTEADLKAWAADLGLDMTAFNSCYDSKQFDAQIQANLAEGQSIGVGGTPSFAIGKPGDKVQLLVGACPSSAFDQAISAAAAGKAWSQVQGSCTINVAN